MGLLFLSIIVLILAAATNAFFIWREAKKDGRPFIPFRNEIVVTCYNYNLLIPAAVTLWFLVDGFKGAFEQNGRT